MLSSRRSRANVARQACDTCRRRKTRCDELRPKCSLCQRLNVECRYDEQSDTKKEENMAQMLDTLTRLEEKIDHISVQSNAASSSASDTRLEIPSLSQRTPETTSPYDIEQSTTDDELGVLDTAKATPPYFTAPHRTIIWPAIYSCITRIVPRASPVLAQLAAGGTSRLMSLEMTRSDSHLRADVGLSTSSPQTEGPVPVQAPGVHFASLTPLKMRMYTRAYFRTFNLVYPVLDEVLFVNDTLPPIISHGFRYGVAESVLTLYVLALGSLAIEASTGAPTGLVNGVPSGICGGTAQRPPGLDISNEGRARVGTLAVCDETAFVQVLLLQGIYFEANACHLDFWRSTMEASHICEVLAQEPAGRGSIAADDLLSRAFWACVMFEDFFHLDLDFPRTGMVALSEQIKLPKFVRHSSTWESADKEEEAQRLPAFHFLAKISLQRVISAIHQTVQRYHSRFEQLQDYTSPPSYVVQELSLRLDSWRAQLPVPLQWLDSELLHETPDLSAVCTDAGVSGQFPTADLDNHLTAVGLEVLACELRARFYHAKFVLHRTYLFKALHFPGEMNEEDVERCVSAIAAGCMWPTALAPARQKKRLVPHLFTWTQNFIALLVILRTSQSNEYLRRICNKRLESRRLERATAEMLHRIRDIKQIDGIGEWSWQFLPSLFAETQPEFDV